jgi:cell wall-associated NlpC family hydrolase
MANETRRRLTLRAVRARTVVAGTLCAAVLAGGAGWAIVGREEAAADALPSVEASITDWRWAPQDPLAEGRRAKAKAEQESSKERPAAERRASTTQARAAEDEVEEEAQQPDPLPESVPEPPPLPDPDGDAALVKAEVLDNGVALPPLQAPPEVRAIIEAGNTIARSPYKWGGGHGKWQDNGYDCSGSVSYALAAAGLIDRPMASGPLMNWGKPGKGKWITIYTNPGHVYMVVAGVRFDTIARGQTGSRWIDSMVSSAGYVARHPEGF